MNGAKSGVLVRASHPILIHSALSWLVTTRIQRGGFVMKTCQASEVSQGKAVKV